MLILSDRETTLRKGGVVVQRGTDHASENRSDEIARVTFVLIDAAFAEPLGLTVNEAEIIP